MTVLGVVLAAGAGQRFRASGGSGPKQLALVEGTHLVVRALEAALRAGLDEVAVVQGAVALSGVVPEGVTVLGNEGWAEGVATSLHVAVAHAVAGGRGALVVGLADQPGVTSAGWAAVATAALGVPIAVATYDGRRGNPVRLAASVWADLPVSGDEGARALIRARPDLVQEVPCVGCADDIDTLGDLRRWW